MCVLLLPASQVWHSSRGNDTVWWVQFDSESQPVLLWHFSALPARRGWWRPNHQPRASQKPAGGAGHRGAGPPLSSAYHRGWDENTNAYFLEKWFLKHSCFDLCVLAEMLHGWWKVSDLEGLLKSLHSRGIRERNLQKQILKHKEHLSRLCLNTTGGFFTVGDINNCLKNYE